MTLKTYKEINEVPNHQGWQTVDGRELDEEGKFHICWDIAKKGLWFSLISKRFDQVLSTTTLGTNDAQEMDDLNPSTEKTYLHHYNFPPYSVGETRPMRTPGRREIGHGALAESYNCTPRQRNIPICIMGC